MDEKARKAEITLRLKYCIICAQISPVTFHDLQSAAEI